MENLFYKANEAKEFIQSKIGFEKIEVSVILGSGLGSLVDEIENKIIIPYSQVPHFKLSTVVGHEGKFIFGQIANKNVLAMQGRIHFYEGYSMKEVTFPIYVMKLLGVDKLIITNSCGGINTMLEPGDLMIIDDFINLMGTNPLIGENDERFGTRFPDMSEPYSFDFIDKAISVATYHNIPYKKGVYAGFMGPYYETRAEIRAYGGMGADAIGMSTVPETIVAEYLGIQTLGIACITNMATGIQKMKHSHANVVAIANKSAAKLSKWILEIIKNL